jgi:diacylglycerol kinase family enzyme
VFAVTSMKVLPTLRLVSQILSKGPKGNTSQLVRDDDAPCLKVTSTGAPIACQFDGDYLGLRQTMTFKAVPDVLPIVAPPGKKRH